MTAEIEWTATTPCATCGCISEEHGATHVCLTCMSCDGFVLMSSEDVFTYQAKVTGGFAGGEAKRVDMVVDLPAPRRSPPLSP